MLVNDMSGHQRTTTNTACDFIKNYVQKGGE
jgi:hypothetical protein